MPSSPVVKITLLVENKSVEKNLGFEHGLSYFIEADQNSIVFDTGQSDLFVHNASKLGLNLHKTDFLVLSHGHYDHTGGLWKLTELAENLKIFGHSAITKTRYSIKDPKNPKSNGIPKKSKAVLSSKGLSVTDHPTQITDHLFVTGEVPRLTNYEDTGGPFFLDPEAKIPDLIPDDQSLWFRSKNGLVIIFGCAHAGMMNTIRYCQKLSGESKIHALIGGFHLLNANRERLDTTIAELKNESPDLLAACHCTGVEATQLMKQHFPQEFRECGSGSVFEFGV